MFVHLQLTLKDAMDMAVVTDLVCRSTSTSAVVIQVEFVLKFLCIPLKNDQILLVYWNEPVRLSVHPTVCVQNTYWLFHVANSSFCIATPPTVLLLSY